VKYLLVVKNILKKVFGTFVGMAVAAVLFSVLIVLYISFDLPKIETLSDYKPPIASQILSKDGTILAEIGNEKREIAQLNEIPKSVVDAFLSAEDSNFYQHSGVDYLGLSRAFAKNLIAGKVVQGGSTITQQLAKSLLLTSERSISRKIKDFLLAQKIEEKFTKDEILFLYLNQVYLGGGYYGVKAAFRGYYDKELSEATVAESAMVAGLLVAPTRYSPYINPEYARNRQGYVLHRLYIDKKITKEQYEAAKKEKIVFRLRRKNEFKAGYFTEWVRLRVIAKVGEENFLKNGYRVVTTLDWELQKNAEKQVLNGVREVDKRQGYKGPIRHDDLTNLAISEENVRKKWSLEKSTFFTIDEKNQKVYEFPYIAEEFVKIKAKSIISEKLMLLKNVKPGYDTADSFVRFLDAGERFEATVTAVNDQLKMVFISIAGVSAIIPQDHFKWAHERYTSDTVRYFTPVTKPSTILAPGDVILVLVEKSGVQINPYFPKEALSSMPLAEQNKLKKEKYILCSLDQYPEIQGSLVSLLPKSGEIVSFVGGNDFILSKFNRVIQSKRQPGSSFKPFVFAAALENGFTPNSIILDTPEALSGIDDTLAWKPKNYDNEFKGPVTFRTSLEQSRNIPTIKIAHKVGIRKISDFMDRITFDAKFDRDLSISLGSFGVAILELVNMYLIFPNQGRVVDYKSISSITDRDGNITTIEEGTKVRSAMERSKIQSEVTAEGENKIKFAPYMANLKESVVYDPRLAYVMTNLLKGVVHHGTAREARELSSNLAGKTGTTSNYVDAWFIGFNPFLVTGVWIGFDDNKSMGYGETGGKAALPVWKEYMRLGIRKYGDEDFQVPDGIVNVPIDKETGDAYKKGVRGDFIEAFVEGTEPGSGGVHQKLDETNPVTPARPGGLVEEEGYLESQ